VIYRDVPSYFRWSVADGGLLLDSEEVGQGAQARWLWAWLVPQVSDEGHG
jgi:hypothetical protein